MSHLKNPILLLGSILLLSIFELQAQNRRTHHTNGLSFEHVERDRLPNQEDSTCVLTSFRSIDGTCNNISRTERMEWGATDTKLYRTMLPEYGNDDPFNAMADDNRPSPRAISNAIFTQSEEVISARGLSSFVFTWGQFIDHDIDLTPEGEIEYEPILLPDSEPLFTEPIPFFRSEIHEGTGEDNFREQTNLISSWIDGSNVYGSAVDRAKWLRTFEDGKLKTSSGNLLPFNTIDGEYESELDTLAPSMAGDNGGTVVTFVAGDVRAAEQPGLTSLHTLFVRYHNQVCDRLIDRGLDDDEDIYQRARKEVGAVIQAITYNEFLPAMGIDIRRHEGYRDNIQADISNIFAAAAYRFGHSMVTEELLLKSENCLDVGTGIVSLLDGFFNPDVLRENNIDPILNGLAVQTQNEIDVLIIDNLRNFLFGDPSAPVVFGLDLASINIQRGRDHGLPAYNAVRRAYTGNRARQFRDITRDRSLERALASTYKDINDIDLWVGLLAEDKLQGSSVGRTLHEILKTQFEQLRDGDRYFYLHDQFLGRRDRDRINNIRLSDVIKLCTKTKDIQRNVFFARSCEPKLSEEEPTAESRTNRMTNLDLEIKIFPNPANHLINVQLDGLVDESIDITIFDNTGRLIRQLSLNNSITQIDISRFSPGMYTVRMKTDAEVIVQRFMKIE